MLKSDLDALEIKEEDFRVKLIRRQAHGAQGTVMVPVTHAPSAVPPVEAPVSEETADIAPNIASPLAGVFYRSSSPTSAPFAKEGDAVEPGQTLCIVEAMKVMNEIKAESRCKIVKIIAENGRPVTAGQPLFLIEPS